MARQEGQANVICKIEKSIVRYTTGRASLLAIVVKHTNGVGIHDQSIRQCVANKQINGKQCTIIWCIDDLKISHVEEKVIEDIIRHLNERFGKESPLTTSRGKILEYLGLTLDYSRRGRVKISMYEYVKKLVEDAPDDMAGVTKTPAGNHLFMINPECDKLPEKTAQVFHQIVAKLLYLCERT